MPVFFHHFCIIRKNYFKIFESVELKFQKIYNEYTSNESYLTYVVYKYDSYKERN